MMLIAKKRGRPRKDIDTVVILHMLQNKAPIVFIARFLGVHRDTLYSSYRPVIDEGLARHRAAWKIIGDEMHRQFLERKRLKEEGKRKKRRYRSGYFNRWHPRPQG